MASPPFANVAAYAAVLLELVPDTKAGRADVDLVADALEKYAEDNPCWESQDVGDGSTKTWDLAASPFTGFVPGFSDQFGLGGAAGDLGVKVEVLPSAGTPDFDPTFLQPGEDFRIEERTVGGAAKLYLVFRTAPGTSLARVHFRKRWTAATVPLHHQLAVVDCSAALKCEALASKYRATVDSVGGSDLFSGGDKAEEYARQAGSFWGAYKRTLGLGSSTSLTTGRIRTGRARVFGGLRGTP